MFFQPLRGLQLRQLKELTLDKPSVPFSGTGELVIPLFPAEDSSVRPCVMTGDRVEPHSPLCASTQEGVACLAVRSPCSATVRDFFFLEHPLRGKVLCAVLTPEANQTPSALPSRLDTITAGSEEILERAREAGIIDETDGRPLYQKLDQAKREGCKIVLADAVDDQPYLTAGLRTLIEQGEQTAKGTVLAATAAGARRSCIAAYLPPELKRLIPLEIAGVSVMEIDGRYPCLPLVQAQLEAWGSGIRVGAQACAALYRAVKHRAPQTECMVTVAGSCIQTPQNLWVPIGTTLREILLFCGLKSEPDHILMGGYLRGREASWDQPIVPEAGAVLAIKEAPSKAMHHCIGCGRCMKVCPVGLAPVLIAQAARRRSGKTIKRLNAKACIACGCCSFVCPCQCDITRQTTEAARLQREEEAQ